MGDEQDSPGHDELCDELLGYLREHPNAMDTLDGGAGWWLPRHRVRIGVEQVAQALQTLEKRALVERIGGDERPMFKLKSKPEPER